MTRRLNDDQHRTTEWDADDLQRIDRFMQGRIRYFGAPCLTRREYEAVVLSLYNMPEVNPREPFVTVPLEAPLQRVVASKMGISQARVSVLLRNAALALLWFEAHGHADVGWFPLRRGRGMSKWDFRAPTLSHPIPPDPEQRRTEVDVVRDGGNRARGYKLVFTGGYTTLSA